MSTERRALAGRAAIVAVGTLFSRLLGLGRDTVIAAVFNRAATDIFFIAFLIPNTLRQLLAEGAMQNGVLPVLTEVRQARGDEAAKSFFRNLRGISLLLLLLISVAGVLAAPWLVDLFAGGYRNEPGQYERTVLITRWVFPYIFFMGTAALGVAALNTHRRFLVTSFAPALLNVSFITCALLLPASFQSAGIDPLLALAVGVLFGGALQVLAQWPSLKAIGYLTWPRLSFTDAAVRQVLHRMTPVLAGFGIYYIDVVVARHLLSDLGVGAQSYFGFALRLCDFPQGIFVMAVQSATLPSLASLAAKKDRQELLQTFSLGLRLALFVAIAASVLMTTLSEPIVRTIFERGQFDATSTHETAASLVALAAGIWAVAATRQVVIVFYALGDTKTPVVVSAIDFLVFLTLALVLRAGFGHVGIAWAVTGAAIAQMLMLTFMLRRKLGPLGLTRITKSAMKTLLAAVAGAFAGVFVSENMQVEGTGWLLTPLPGLLGCAAFGIVFLLAARMLRSEELASMVDPVLRKLSGRRR